MKVKNNKYQLSKMLQRKRDREKNGDSGNTNGCVASSSFTDKEIDDFRSKNNLPRLTKQKNIKKPDKNTKTNNHTKLLFKENDDYGTDIQEVSFDVAGFKTKPNISKKLMKSLKNNCNTSKDTVLEANNNTFVNKTHTENIRAKKTFKKKINETTIQQDNESIRNKETVENVASQNEDQVMKKTARKRKNKDTTDRQVNNDPENTGSGVLSKTKRNKSEEHLLQKTRPTVNKLEQQMQRYQRQLTSGIEQSKGTHEDKKEIIQQIKPKRNFKKEKLKKLLEQAASKPANAAGNALRDRMLQKLKAAQFRYLNEKLYTCTGSEAQQLFQADPSAFAAYHEGYRQQLTKWPLNPLHVIANKICKMPKTHIIADMGCGDASLSKRVPHTVHSLDLVASAPHVVACDMARTPLGAQAVHVAVYCLALMGTQLTKYLKEANRVLKTGGRLLIAEVESRFDDVNAFARDVERLGFKLKHLDQKHQVFFFLDFEKVRDAPAKANKLPDIKLKPCIYKKR